MAARRALRCLFTLLVTTLFAPPGAWATSLGLQRQYALQSFSPTDRISLHVNLANGNLVLHQRDLVVQSRGIDVVLDRYYNSLSGTATDLGYGWRLGTGADVKLTVQPDSSILFDGPSGYQVTFTPDGHGSYLSPTAIDATLSAATGTICSAVGYTLTFHGSGTKLQFSSAGKLVAEQDRNGNKTCVAYDGNGRLSSLTDSESRAITFTPNGSGDISTITDSTTRSWSFGYNGSRDLTTFTDAATFQTMYSYDGSHRLTQVTNPSGKQTKIAYDPVTGRVTTITRVTDVNTGTGFVWSFTYGSDVTGCPAGSVAKNVVTSPPNPTPDTTTYCFDAQDRALQVTDGLLHAQSLTYNADSNVVRYTNALSGYTQNTYDPSNSENLTQSQGKFHDDSAGPVSAFAYGDTTHPTYATKTTSPQGNIINFAYDANGNACAKSEGDLAGLTLTCTNLVGNDPVKFVYNTDGTIATATDARGKITSYGYDSLGRLTSITFPSPLGGVSFTYDSLNRVRTFTNGKGQVTTYGYDNLDRLKTIAYAGSGTITFNYDSDDNVQSRVDSNGNKTTSYFYDQLNRLTEADYPSGAVVKYGYDGVGNLTSFTDGTQTVGYGYDDAERLTTLTEPNGQQTTFGYDNDNNRTLVTYPSATGVTIAMTYDDLDRVKTVLAQKGATRYVDLTYARTNSQAVDQDAITSVTDAGSTTQALYGASIKTSYGYELHTSRLLNAETKNLSTQAVLDERQYAYDGSGNRCRSYVGTAPFAGSFDCSATGSGVTAYTYNDANELTAVGATSYGYDLNGNETGPSGGLLLDYNDRDQTSNMTPPGGNSFGIVYDGPGQWERAQVGSQTSFVNSQLGVSSSGSTYWTRDNGGQLLEQRTSTGNDYYLFDGQGSILGLIDASGNLVGNFSYRYDPYGQQLNSEPTGYPSNSWRFQGQYLDANVGLYKMGQRYYDPATGRWTQRDPLDNALDTHGWNRYDYAGDDPVNSVDPSGMCWTGLCWIKHTYNALAGAQAWTESVLGRYGSACLWGAIQGATVGAITGAAAGGVGAAPGAATGAVEGCSAGVAIRLAATLSEKAAATGEAAAFIHDVFELVNASKE